MSHHKKKRILVRLSDRFPAEELLAMFKGRLYTTIEEEDETSTIEYKHPKALLKSEVPVLYSDEDDPYPLQRPHTDQQRGRGQRIVTDYSRYEPSRLRDNVGYREPREHRKFNKRGKLVTFFRNGDPDFKGIVVCISQKSFPNYETLLMHLNDKIETTTGVRHIFLWPEGAEITTVTQFVQGKTYIVSSVRKLNRSVQYGFSRELYWQNKRPSAGKVRKADIHMFKRPLSPSQSPTSKKPRILTIISNLARESREKLILNPQTTQNFEDLLMDICALITVPKPPVKALYTEKSPHMKVSSYSQLFNDFRSHDNFIACGQETLPNELVKKRQAPSSNSSSESVGQRSRKKKLHRQSDVELHDISELNGVQRTPSPTLDNHPPSLPPPPLSPISDSPPSPLPYGAALPPVPNSNKQLSKDSVRVEIDGKTKEFFPPTIKYPDDDGAKPDKKLKLDWVYGFRGRDTKYNLVVLPSTGELVYYVAAVVILYKKTKDAQRHYLGHNEEVSCIALHPNQRHVATGQLEGKTMESGAHIRIWDGESLSTYSVIGLGVFQKGIASIGFSNQSSGDFMCVVDEGDKHVLTVWEWERERLVAKTTTSTEPVTCGCFYQNDDTILITFGKQHVYFWKLFWDPNKEKDGRILRDRKSGNFDDEIPKMITSVAFSPNGDVLTGDSNGSILVWTKDDSDAFMFNRPLSEYMRHAHKKPVNSLCMLEDGTLLSGGANEVKAWDTVNSYKQVKERVVPEVAGHVRVIVPQNVGGADGNLYIGTTKSCILDGSLQHKFKFLVQGHSEELWAVTAHPEEPAFITAGHDQVVIKWSASSHKVIWRVQVEKPCSAISIDNRGRLVALGTTDGRFIILNAYNGMHVTSIQVGRDQIDTVKFSPDGTLLAMGSHDGDIHLYSVQDDGQFYRKYNTVLKGHKNFLTQMDWSSDNRFIESVSADYELFYWDVDNTQPVKNGRLVRDQDWCTQTCNIGYSLIGPWSNMDPGEHLHVVSRSHYRDFIVTGDSKGRIRLYKYPSSTEKPQYRAVKIYSSDVTTVDFLSDDTKVVTSGGQEAALVQWAVVDPATAR